MTAVVSSAAGKRQPSHYRILSLDGGGVWALIEVKALIALYGEEATGHQVLRDFDLVAANSGGSLVLGGLVEDLPLKHLLTLFEDEAARRDLFAPTAKVAETVLRRLTGLGPKYSAAHKLGAIERALPQTGGKPMSEATRTILGPSGKPVRLLVVAYDYDRQRAAFFRSYTTTSPSWGAGAASSVTLAQAIHASTNAPVDYFDAPAEIPGCPDRYWDGAIAGCNNPLLAALTEAATLDQPLSNVRALSLGTGSVCLPPQAGRERRSPLFRPRVHSNLAGDLRLLATSILEDPPDAATFIAHAHTGGSKGVEAPAVSRIVRMSPMIQPVRDAQGRWHPPAGLSEAQFQALANIGMDAVDPRQVRMISAYCDLWLGGHVPNQPIRADGNTLAAEVGYGDFPAARRAWRSLVAPTAAMRPDEVDDAVEPRGPGVAA